MTSIANASYLTKAHFHKKRQANYIHRFKINYRYFEETSKKWRDGVTFQSAPNSRLATDAFLDDWDNRKNLKIGTVARV